MAGPKKQRGLGKGLDALFGDAEVTLRAKTETPVPDAKPAEADKFNENTDDKKQPASGIEYVDINEIKPNSTQPRKVFDEDKLQELASSIEEHGLIQPIVLRKAEKGYEIVAGERRWRAARLIGIRELPAIVREFSDEENMLLAIIENMQREDLNPIEEAEGISQMMNTYGLTQEQVSKSLGKSRPYIANSLRLLKIADKVKQYVIEGKLSSGHARALAGISDEAKQVKIAEAAVKKGLSVREIEKLVKQEKDAATKKPRIKKKNADVIRVEEDLKEIFGTKVNLNQRGKKGRIEIEFYSREDLERLIDLLKSLH